MSMFGNILIYVKLQIQICFNAWSLNLYHVLLPYPIYMYVIGRHRYPLVDCWWYHYINRQWVVSFSPCHHKRIPTCAVTDWYTHSNHCQRRLTKTLKAFADISAQPLQQNLPRSIYNPSCWIANLTIVHFLLIVIITYKHLTCTPSTDDLDTYLFTVHITSILLQFVRSTNTNSK